MKTKRSRAGVTLIEMMIVVMIIAVIAGVSFPALTSGLSSVRLSSASGSSASFLAAAMNQVDRRELAAVSRYAVEQGIIDRQLAVEDLFAPSTLSLSKV